MNIFRMTKILLFWTAIIVLFVLCIPQSGHAEETPVTPAELKAIAQEKTSSTGIGDLSKKLDEPITLTLNNVEPKEAMLTIYQMTGVNIVLSTSWSGKISINAENIPLRQVFDSIAESNNLVYFEQDNVITIMTPRDWCYLWGQKNKAGEFRIADNKPYES